MFPHRSRRGSPSLLAAEGAQLGTTLIRSDVCRSTAIDDQVVELVTALARNLIPPTGAREASPATSPFEPQMINKKPIGLLAALL